MGSLELDIRQMILSDLASNIGEVKTESANVDNVLSAIDLITSKVETRALTEDHNKESLSEEEGYRTWLRRESSWYVLRSPELDFF